MRGLVTGRVATWVLAITVALGATPGRLMAQDFEPMTGAQIEAGLKNMILTYPGGELQSFFPSGRTLYDAGRPSWGYWEVRGDQYCSQWPPADGWACYDMDTNGTVLRFIGESGDVTPGTVHGRISQ